VRAADPRERIRSLRKEQCYPVITIFTGSAKWARGAHFS
jgi:hypothetical protein